MEREARGACGALFCSRHRKEIRKRKRKKGEGEGKEKEQKGNEGQEGQTVQVPLYRPGRLQPLSFLGERWSWTKARGPLSHPKTRALP